MSDAGRRDVPSLHQLCLALISDGVINLDNALFVLDFARAHAHAQPLEARAHRFVRDSFAGLRARHSREEMERAIGTEEFAAMDLEQCTIDAATRRMKTMGSVTARTAEPLVPPLAPWRSSAPGPASGRASECPSEQPMTRRRFSSLGGGGTKCAACAKTVYPAEETKTHERSWHHACFRCVQCSQRLGLHNFELDPGGALYCKTHFMQAWKAKGSGAAQHLGEERLGAIRLPEASAALGATCAARADGAPASASATPAPTPPETAAAQSVTVRADGAPASASATPAPTPPPPPAPPATNTGTARWRPFPEVDKTVGAWVASQAIHCARCAKAVYAMELEKARSHRGEVQAYHKKCFRCAECNTLLRQGNYELYDGVLLLCQTHYAARCLAHTAAAAEGDGAMTEDRTDSARAGREP
jgi:hypothetical protein